jgi:hypothetical protein
MKKITLFTMARLLALLLISGTYSNAQSVDCNMTLKTTIQGFKVYKHTASGAILFKAKMAIDADGSPRAYGPNNSGLDYTANAGHPGNWWGVVTNNSGNPIIQNSSNPYPGMYVSTTSLVNNSYPATNPLHYVNSEAIPFFVLPSAVTQLGNIHLGDIGYVYNTVTGQGCYAIFADGGPAGKLGEGSIYLANQIGVNSNARTGGTTQGIIDYIVFPGSGSGQGVFKTVSQIDAIGSAQIATVGGTDIVNCLNPNSCGVPTTLSVSGLTASSATLGWSAVAGASSYNIKYKNTSLSTWTIVSSSTNSKTISGLSAATSYEFQVQAVCSSAGVFSASSSFTTASNLSCGVPSGLSAGSITQNGVSLNWNSVSGASSYTIQYKPVSSSSWTTVTSSTASVSISGLTTATAYEFKVQAVCSSAGNYSLSTTFTTASASYGDATITVGTGTSAYSSHPFGTIYMDERTQYIITKQELMNTGWSSATPYLTSMAFNVLTASSQPMNSFTVTIAHTSSASFGSTSFSSGTGSTVVYTGTVATTQGWNTYSFTTPFAYNGTSNLLISICWDNNSFTTNSSVESYSYSNYLALYYRVDLSSGGVCGHSTGTRSYYRPNTKLTFSASSSGMAVYNDQGLKNMSIENNETEVQGVSSVEVFPNPSDGAVLYGKLTSADGSVVAGESDKTIAVKIMDMLGREVFSSQVPVREGLFSVSLQEHQLQQGMYLFSGVIDNSSFTRTIVVK